MRPSRKRLLFVTCAIALSLLVPTSALLATDVYLHHRFERGVLFNVWGYRGPVARRKQSGEYRVAVFGGSAAFGFGVRWDESMPQRLEQKLAERSPRFRVVNLAYNNEGAYSFVFTMRDYAYLQYDLVVLYEGYNDLMGDSDNPNRAVFRHGSPVFRVTGYLPVFPLIFREKASVLLYGDTRAAYRSRMCRPRQSSSPVSRPEPRPRILRAAADIGDSMERQLGRVSVEPRGRPIGVSSGGCDYPWAEYCESMYAAMTWALDHQKQGNSSSRSRTCWVPRCARGTPTSSVPWR